MFFRKNFLFSIFLLTLFACTSPEKNTTHLNKNEIETTKSSTIKFYENRAKNLNEGLKELAISIGNEMQKENINTVAVYDFLRIDGEKDDFGRLLSEELTTNLFALRKFQIIERNMLESILEENKLQLSQIVDQKTAKEIGKITGVDALFLGTYIDSGDHIRINARIISTETGAIFSASSISVIKEIFISQLIKVDNSEHNKTMVDTQIFSQNQDKIISSSTKSSSEYETENFKNYLETANYGYTHAQLQVGIYYFEGNEVLRDYNKAIYWFRKAADGGSTRAESWLGYMYQMGHGVNRDYKEALRWYQRAASKNDSYSITKLGEFYYNGYGVAVDYYKAFSYFKNAAEKADKLAQSWLGYMYRFGNGVMQNFNEAIYWYKKAIEKGDNYSKNQLGEMYFYGQGFTKNLTEAFNLFKETADNGDAKGASWLGYMYRYAQGVNRDYGQALYWFGQAEAKGDAYSMNQLGEMYYYGQGVNIDYQKARMYFESAKNKGNKTAEENLKSKF